MAKFLKRYNTQEEYDQDLPNLNKEWMIGYVKEGKKVNYLNNPYYRAVVLRYRFTEEITDGNAFFNLIPETESVLINGVSYDPSEISSKSWSAGEYEVKFYPKSSSETINYLNCEENERLVEVYIDDNCGITGVQDYAFRSCQRLEKVHLSNKITEIGENAFEYCTSLIKVVIPDPVTVIKDHSFNCCSSLAEVKFGNNITHIYDNAFSNCYSLTELVIPDSVTNISYGAFWQCHKLTSVTLGQSITSIGNYVFDGCGNLTKIIIPDSVTSIGNYAFRKCTGLKEIVIPDSVTSLGHSAFTGCSSLTSAIIGNSITNLSSTFYNCTSLSSINFSEGSILTSIDDLAFAHCPLTSIDIPKSVTSIGESAFYGCSFTTITIPKGVTSIGNRAFQGCIGLTSITCFAINAPSIYSTTFRDVLVSGTLYYPQGSDYSSWMSTSSYYLGYYNWISQEIEVLIDPTDPPLL